MLKEIIARLKQGYRTIAFPDKAPPELPDRFRGRPVVDSSKCGSGCHACADACPVDAIDPATRAIDLGRCLFCTDCTDACPSGAITFTRPSGTAGISSLLPTGTKWYLPPNWTGA